MFDLCANRQLHASLYWPASSFQPDPNLSSFAGVTVAQWKAQRLCSMPAVNYLTKLHGKRLRGSQSSKPTARRSHEQRYGLGGAAVWLEHPEEDQLSASLPDLRLDPGTARPDTFNMLRQCPRHVNVWGLSAMYNQPSGGSTAKDLKGESPC